MAYTKRYTRRRSYGPKGLSPLELGALGLGGLLLFTKASRLLGSWFGPETKNSDSAAVLDEKKRIAEKMPVNLPALKADLMYYDSIADGLERAMNASGTDGGQIMELLEGLNVEELKQVYKAFNVRTNHTFGFPLMTGNLIDWFLYETEDGYDSTFLRPKLREIWEPTGLWR